MITFKDEKPYTEGIVGDSMKAAADVAKIPVDDISDAFAAIDKNAPSEYSGSVQKTNVAIDKGGKTIEDHLNDLTYRDSRITTKSIVARARNSVLQFPMYVTQSLPVNYAQTIAKLFERVYTTLVQTTLSQSQFITQADANELVFLKQFHTNLNESAVFTVINEYYEPIDDIDAIMKEAADYSEEIAPGIMMKTRVVPCANSNLIAENARLLHEPLYGLNYLQEADKNDVSKKVDSNKKDGNYNHNLKPVDEIELQKLAVHTVGFNATETECYNRRNDEELLKQYASSHNMTLDEAKEIAKKAEEKFDNEVKNIKKKIMDGKIPGYYVDKTNGFIYKDSKTPASDTVKSVDAPKLLHDSDVKKINGMLPYTIEASFIITETNRAVHFIIGIKTVMHLISTKDLGEDLHGLVTGDISSLRKVRYKTGEIKFMDYVFNVKQIKRDAAKHINYNKRWINTLKRLSEYDKVNGSLLKAPARIIAGGHIPIPNGTLVLSQTDVTMMTNSTGIDISTVSNAKRLAKSLFLIAICIVDNSAGSMRVLFPDSDSDWDVQSLHSIESELSKTDNSALMQELNKKINR